MNPPQMTVEVAKTAWEQIIENGTVGAILAIVLASSIALVFWVIKTYNRKDEARDQYVQDVNERRAETAEKAIEAQTKTNERLSRLIDMMSVLLERVTGHAEEKEND